MSVRKKPPETTATPQEQQPQESPQPSKCLESQDLYEVLIDKARSRARYFFAGTERARLWTWKDFSEGGSGLWTEDGETRLRAFLQLERRNMICDDKGKKLSFDKMQKECIGLMRARLADEAQEMPTPPRHLVACQNGVWNLQEREFEEFRAEHWFIAKLPYRYDPEAARDNETRVRELFKTWVDQPDYLLELMAYCLYRSYPLQKFFVLLGQGRNGKSQYLILLRAVLGEKNCQSIPLDELETEKQLVGLKGKFANIVVELPVKVLNDSGVLKRLTGGDPISSDVKFKDRVEFLNHAKMIFGLNTLPPTADKTDAFYRRVDVLEFPRKFEENADMKDFAERKLLTDKWFMTGLFSLALERLQKAYDNDLEFDFIGKGNAQETRVLYSQLSDTVEFFVREFCEQDDESSVMASLVLQAVNAIRRQRGIEPVSPISITYRMSSMGFEKQWKQNADREKIGVFHGLRLNTLKLAEYVQQAAAIVQDDQVSAATLDAWNTVSATAIAVLRAVLLGYGSASQLTRVCRLDSMTIKYCLDELKQHELIVSLGNGFAAPTDPYLLAELKYLFATR